VEFVKLDYMFKNGKLLSQERIDQYWGNLYCVADFAFHSSVCPENPISKRKVLNPINKAIDERQKRRSINTRETSQLMSLLAEDFDKCNTTLGTALQMFLGLRTAEACGPNFRDVLNFYDSSGRCYISSYTQNRSNVGKEYNKFSGQKKSVNGYRYIPVPKQLQYLIERKREKLFELGFTESEISSMPLVSEDVSNVKDLEQARTKAKIRCDSSKLGIAGGRRLYSVLKTRANVEIPCEDDSLLAEDPSDEENNALKKIWNEIESDSQSYVLRRNFATYLFGICGLTTAEVQYLMGHKQDNNKGCVAIDFTAESILRKIQNKMDRLICFPDIDAEGKGDFFEKLSISNPKEILQRINCAPNSTVQTEINDDVECCFSFVPDSSESSIEITIVLQAAEPMDELKIEFQSEDELTYLAVASDAVSTSPAETANVLSYYYDDIFSVSVEAEPNKVDCSVESSGDQGIDNDFLDYEAAVENQIEYYEKNVDIAKDEPEDKDNIDGDENDEEN